MSNHPEIEKNIPIPERGGGRRPENQELLKRMDIGDSIYFPDSTTTMITNRFYNPSKTVGVTLAYRKVGTGVRMWRTK